MATPEAGLEEARRQFLLGVAGVRIWYARTPLAGAAPSLKYEFPPEEEEPAGASPEQGSPGTTGRKPARAAAQAGVPQRSGRIAGLQQLVSGASPAPQQPQTAPAKTADLRPAVADAEQKTGRTSPVAELLQSRDSEAVAPAPVSGGVRIRGHWGFWVAGDWCLMSLLSDTASRDLEDRLARAVLQALGAGPAVRHELKWPVFSNPDVPGADSGSFQRVLSRLVRSWPDSSGKRPQKLIFLEGAADDGQGEAVVKLLGQELAEPCVRCAFTLAALAAEPALKRTLWESLRPLAGSAGQ